jgi:hypothetical protein
MAQSSNPWLPSEAALAFGESYAAVLARWGELFTAASELVAANVALGRAAGDSAAEFQQWVAQGGALPWNWLRPDMFERFSEFFRPASPSG